jgi:hypothetical protein
MLARSALTRARTFFFSVLAVLVRFSYSGMSRFLSRGKLETNVQFPIDPLNLSDHAIAEGVEPPIYQLYAISNHFGGMGGGVSRTHCSAAIRS